MITRCADTGRVPPARGVTVSAAAFPAGLRTVKIEFVVVVDIIAIPTISEVPVARPATVYSKSSSFKVKIRLCEVPIIVVTVFKIIATMTATIIRFTATIRMIIRVCFARPVHKAPEGKEDHKVPQVRQVRLVRKVLLEKEAHKVLWEKEDLWVRKVREDLGG